MIVAKFGGAVLNGAEGLRRACREIESLPKPLLVVVSAFADVTNRLEHLAEVAVDDTAAAREELGAFVGYHRDVARELLSDEGYRGWLQSVEPFVSRLEEIIEGLGIVRELSSRTLDLAVHFGERFSSALLLAALADNAGGRSVAGVSALDLIITDSSHRYARPDLELTRERVDERLRPALAAHDIVITEGYIARTSTGQATTMGRESSNYSATLLGGMLGADAVRIYTGVPGILTADPVRFPEARTIPRMSYGMANTLAELGAKVLHPRTVLPVERARIPLVITSIGGESTTIGVAGESGCSVVLLPEAGLISVDTTTAGVRIGPFIRAIGAEAPVIWYQRFRRRLQILVAHGYPSTRIPVGQIPEPAHAESADVAIVSVVQEETFSGKELERFFAAVGAYRPLALQGGIGRHAISIAIDRSAALDVARELHRRFVEHAEEAERWPSHPL